MRRWSRAVLSMVLLAGGLALAAGQDSSGADPQVAACVTDCKKDGHTCAKICTANAGQMAGKCTQACQNEERQCEKECKNPSEDPP